METSTWELPSLPLLHKPPSANPTLRKPGLRDLPSIPARSAGQRLHHRRFPFPGMGARRQNSGWLKMRETRHETGSPAFASACCRPRPRAAGRQHALSRQRPCAAWHGVPGSHGEAGMPLIAVNDVLYHHPDRRELQDVLTCIREHLTIDRAGRRLAVNAERYLKPACRDGAAVSRSPGSDRGDIDARVGR